nr:alpha/beta hydrolase [Pseudofrankia inefficax]
MVTAADGVRLHVEETGPPDAELTVVFVHGFCMTSDAWVFQRRGLADLGRLVCYDQRAHGRSGPSEAGQCTITQLADDLYRVLNDRVATGPVVLVGHSMGGMTILGLADAHPDLFRDRIVAVALLSTSAGELPRLAFGLPAAMTTAVRHVLSPMAVGLRHTPSVLERLRGKGGTVSRALTRRFGFGPDAVPESTVDRLEKMIAATPVPVLGAFLSTLLDHDRLEAVGALRALPTLLLVGDADVMTPIEHSKVLADALPDAELAIEKGAGHAVILERPDAVNAHLRALVHRAQHATRRPNRAS